MNKTAILTIAYVLIALAIWEMFLSDRLAGMRG